MKQTTLEGNSAWVYKISCSVNGKIYVGSTVNLASRKSEHFKKLSSGTHHCKPLQNAFNKYGKQFFELSIIELFKYETRKDILDIEQKYIDLLKPKFNTYLIAGSPLGTKYGTYSSERRRKLSEGMKGIPKSVEHKKLLSEIKLKGTSINKPVISSNENGIETEYIGVCDAARRSGVSIPTIYDSINNKPKKWKRKTTNLTWKYKTATV